MNCMKCGRETTLERVFCEDCLLDMEKYPVKPGTVVQIPRRKEAVPVKKGVKRRTYSPEEQIKLLRKRVRNLTIALILAAALAIAMIYPTVAYLREDHFLPGQNYTSIPKIQDTVDNNE